MQFEDQDNYLVFYLLPLAGIAYLLVLLLRNGSLLKLTIAAILSFLTYFLLNKFWENTYKLNGVPMLLTVVGIMAAIIGVAYAAIWILVLVITLALAVPTLQHNADVIAVGIGAPEWVGYILLFTGLIILLLLIWLARIVPIIGLLLKVAFTSLFLQVMLRQLYLENPPDMDRTDMACFNSSTDPPGRCALTFDSYAWMAIFLLLLLLQVYTLYQCRCKRKKPAKPDRTKYTKVKEEEEEEDIPLEEEDILS